MKAVLRLMMINFADPGMRVFLGICVLVLVGTFFLQHTVMAEMPPARRSVFVLQFMLLAGFLVPWALIHPRGFIARGWSLVPWARLKVVLSAGLTITLLAAVSALCYVAGMSGTSSEAWHYFAESAATFPSTFVLLSLFGLQILASAAPPWRQVAAGMVGIGLFVVAIVYSMARGLPQVTDEAFRAGIWLAFGACVLAWLMGGWWFVNRRATAAAGDWNLFGYFDRLRAKHLLRKGPVATLLQARWNPQTRTPMVLSWIVLSFGPLSSRPAGQRDGFIVAAAFFALLTGMRAVYVTYDTVRSARVLWLMSGNRDELFGTCSRILIRNTTFIGCCAGLGLLAVAWLADRVVFEGNVVGIASGLALCVFVPQLAVYLGLHGMSLPEPARWRFWSIWLVLIIFAAFVPVMHALANFEYDATGVLSACAAIAFLWMLVLRQRARHWWRRVDWTFLPAMRAPRQAWHSLRS